MGIFQNAQYKHLPVYCINPLMTRAHNYERRIGYTRITVYTGLTIPNIKFNPCR